MYLERLFLMNYRNISQAELQFSPKINCLVGDNGMGKTNILDAIHYLSFCRSSLSPTDSQTILHDSGGMMLSGTYHSDVNADSSESFTISSSLRTGGRKQFKRDGKDYRRFSEHIGLIPLVMISPDDSMLISGGSEERRKFMDIVISQYDRNYLEHLINYNKALSQRNALLKCEPEPDSGQFEIWEMMMANNASFIYGKRKEFIDTLIPYFQEMYSEIGNGSEQVGLSYRSHLDDGPLDLQLADMRAKERIVGFTLHGIHRDELEMTLGGYPIRREGSQGQNKSFLTALKLAQYKHLAESCGRRKPLLLLDDLFDKLDSKRVENILRLVSGDCFGQIFITDVNRSHLDQILELLSSDFRIFTVTGGEVI